MSCLCGCASWLHVGQWPSGATRCNGCGNCSNYRGRVPNAMKAAVYPADPKPPACAVCGHKHIGATSCMVTLSSSPAHRIECECRIGHVDGSGRVVVPKPAPACHCPVGSVVEGCPCGRFVSAAMAWVAAVERPTPESAAIHAAQTLTIAEALANHRQDIIATLETQLAEARGMALTEVTDLLRNVLSRSLVSATEKLIVEVILDKIEALKAGAK